MRLSKHLAAAAVTGAVIIGVSACGGADLKCGEDVECVETGKRDISCDFADSTGEPVTLMEEGSDTFYVIVRNFDLRPQGSCGARDGCGHAHIYVEGCNLDAETHGNMVRLDVSQCGEGEHEVVMVLHDDAHAVYAHDGTPITAYVTVNVTQAGYANQHHSSGKWGNDSDCDSDSDSDSK